MMSRWAAGACLGALLLAACASSDRNLSPDGVANQLEPREVSFPDGGRSLYYTHSVGKPSESDTLIFFIGGSGCSSLSHYLRQFFQGLQGSVAIFALQKRHVGDRKGGRRGCGEEFERADHFSQWVADHSYFLDFILNREGTGIERVALMGVSEGGLVAAAIAAHPRVTHLVMLGSGGLRQLDELRIVLKKRNWSLDADRLYQRALSNPLTISQRAFGHSYKYWASVLEEDPLQYLLPLQIPILVAIGENDVSTPVESALYLNEKFEAAGKRNLSLVVYRGANHGLVARGKSYRPEFVQYVSDWLND